MIRVSILRTFLAGMLAAAPVAVLAQSPRDSNGSLRDEGGHPGTSGYLHRSINDGGVEGSAVARTVPGPSTTLLLLAGLGGLTLIARRRHARLAVAASDAAGRQATRRIRGG